MKKVTKLAFTLKPHSNVQQVSHAFIQQGTLQRNKFNLRSAKF